MQGGKEEESTNNSSTNEGANAWIWDMGHHLKKVHIKMVTVTLKYVVGFASHVRLK